MSLGRGAVWFLLAALLALTLFPEGSSSGTAEVRLLENRQAADSLLNIVLFAPLGASLAVRRHSLTLAALVALLLSGLIETGQLLITSRDPTVRDLVANTFGGLIGHQGAVWLREPPGALPKLRRLALPVAAVVTAGFLAAGLLLEVTLPQPPYSLFRTPGNPLPEEEEWTVHSVRAGGAPLGVGPLDSISQQRIQAFLEGDTRLAIEGSAGASTPSSRPLVVLVNANEGYLFGLEAHGGDLLLRWPRRGDRWLFDNPFQRIERVFHPTVPERTSFYVSILRTAEETCIELYDQQKCTKATAIDRAWALLLAPKSWSKNSLQLMDFAFLFLVFFLLGVTFTSSPWGLAAILTAGGLLVLVPPLTSVPAADALSFAGVVAGLIIGLVLQRKIRSRQRRSGEEQAW